MRVGKGVAWVWVEDKGGAVLVGVERRRARKRESFGRCGKVWGKKKREFWSVWEGVG